MLCMSPKRPYRLDPEPLGRGGFGIVHRATHRVTQEVVAFKKALPGGQAAARMKREIEVQQSMSHHHVMPILDADPNFRWFTMPLATDSLAKRCYRRSPTDLLLATILHQVAGGLQYAHFRGHIHRDVTPGNILRLGVDASSRWVVADWGLVQKPEGQESLPLTLTGQVLGTRSFGPPELMTAPHGVGPEVDVYYIGALAAWALTGDEPSPHHMPLPARREWRELVLCTTQKDPTARPQTMVDVLAMLHDMREQFENEHVAATWEQQALLPLNPAAPGGPKWRTCVATTAALTTPRTTSARASRRAHGHGRPWPSMAAVSRTYGGDSTRP